MSRYSLSLAAVALLVSGGIASAEEQRQFDSLGMPTPAPQTVSPNAVAPNVPVPGTTGQKQKDEYHITPPAQGLSTELPVVVKPNADSTTGQAPKSPNAPYADD